MELIHKCNFACKQVSMLVEKMWTFYYCNFNVSISYCSYCDTYSYFIFN